MIGLCLKDIACKEGLHLDGSASLKQAVELMDSNGKGVVVILGGDIPVGILTERDIVEILYRGIDLNSPVINCARKDLITIKEDKTIGYALNLMVANNIRRIILTDDSNNFKGIITQQDMIKYLEDDFYRSTIKIKHLRENIKPLISIAPDDTLNDALKKIAENEISAVPVIKGSRAVGMITEKDILKIVRNNISLNESVFKFMSSPVVAVSMEDSLLTAVKIMNTKRIRRVVIENSSGDAIGIITNRDLINNLEGDYTTFIERKLKHTRDILNLLPEMLLEIVDAGREQLIIWANERAVKKFGDGIVNKPVTSLIPYEKWEKIYGTLGRFNKVEDIKVKKDEEIYEISGFFIKTEEESCGGKIQLILRDITDEVKLYTTDPLTGLYNRRFLNEFLHKELELSKRYQRQLSLAIADIDDFKKLNDTYGHIAGDAVLKSTARIMLKNIRDADILSRYGGEEFVIVMPEINKEMAVHAIERLRGKISSEDITLPDRGRIKTTVSFGIASYPEDSDSSVDLLITADDRLYKAKREGKNMVVSS